ncbi:N-acetylglucosamine-6-phosphate deacetylase [Stakelama pacifica]|uniref:N-acetylglucosamine 6-phosphate deacetylase n=1 Tax=Stakelama pacifica TaxID=517720 RepID=A0A4R6FHN2_9SPHN|nr:N-acetylglucosamine-6-phosphate deacetylase [Stakelama pacifica]TDN80310.1 N-acetylglucosamine 6-phosphate deacetylase [Stakelama pacifica]GGO97945.1 N-acetylglucosamine-6-phosphate deacetylase [Stakelama pacifica]
MTRFSFRNGGIITPEGALSGATIEVSNGRIADIAPLSADADIVIDLDGGWLVPGFIDVQVNGGGGVLFNDAPTVEGMAAIARAHARFGTTALLPTLISDGSDVIARALDALDAAMAAGVPGVVGAHIEGPVFNEKRHGIHDPARVRRFDPELIELLARPRAGVRLVTLAPEKVERDQIARLINSGILLSIGHSDADYETARSAIDAGVTGITHLYNAMSPLHHRAPGIVGAALEDDRVYCGLIADGFHVHDAALRVALRARPRDRMMLVTDAMPCVGGDGSGSFDLQGRTIHVEAGRCFGDDGTLAGSALDMASAFRNAVTRLHVTPEHAVALSATNPAAFLGLSYERGALACGLVADWVQLDADFRHVDTWIGGNRFS